MAPPAGATELNRVILRVNDRIVTLYDYRERLSERQHAIRKAEIPPDAMLKELAGAPNGVLREMMDEVLLLSRGDQLGSEVSESRIDEAISATRKNMSIDDDAQWVAALQQYGMSEASFRTRTRDNLLFQEVMGREVRGKIKVEEEDLQKYYREHPKEFESPSQMKLREIVVLEGVGRTPAELAALAADLHRQLEGGKLESSPLRAPHETHQLVLRARHGHRQEARRKLEAACADVPLNGYSQPVVARGGLHILQVLERIPSRCGLQRGQPELESAEKNRRFQTRLATMQQLEKDIYQASPPRKRPQLPRHAPAHRKPGSTTSGGRHGPVARQDRRDTSALRRPRRLHRRGGLTSPPSGSPGTGGKESPPN